MDVGAVHARAARVVLALLRSRRESDLGACGSGPRDRRWQAAAFALGLLSIAVALISPVAWLSGILFSVHMTQHEILMLVSAPLLVFGHPLLALLWAVPPQTRAAWGRWTQSQPVAAAWRALTGPLAVFLLHAIAIWAWHIPRLYEAALTTTAFTPSST